MYSTQQPMSYSYTAPTAGSGSLQPGYISPPESRRALDDDKEKSVPPQRQSLPSIHEALGNDNPLPYHGPPTSAPQQVHHAPPSHATSPGFAGRSGGEAPPGPPNPFNSPFSHHHQHQLQQEASRSSLTSINTQESKNPSLQSLSSARSPTQSAKTGITSISGSQTSGYEYSAPPSAGSIASPNGYAPPFSQSFSFQSQAPSYPSAHYDPRPYQNTPWKPNAPEPARVEEIRNEFASRPSFPGHSDSMKRHLEIYDVEASLNEVSRLCTVFALMPNQC